MAGMYDRLFRERRQPRRVAQRVEDIRLSMLDMLGEAGTQRFPNVERRMRQAPDALALWYARADLMAALAELHGEHFARAKTVSLTVLFDGLLPKGMISRPTTLRG